MLLMPAVGRRAPSRPSGSDATATAGEILDRRLAAGVVDAGESTHMRNPLSGVSAGTPTVAGEPPELQRRRHHARALCGRRRGPRGVLFSCRATCSGRGGAALLAFVVGTIASGCGTTITDSQAATGDVAAGKAAYDLTCAACHGPGGRGTTSGPPFLDRIYEPSHHGDAAFVLAVTRGVRAHHWRFGDMPPQPGLSDVDISNIVAYVRSEQRAAGIR